MKERPISVITGHPSQRGKRLRTATGMSWSERNRSAINARRRTLYSADASAHRARASRFRKANAKTVNAYNAAWGVEYRARLRSEFLTAYGGCCSCCGESQPLFLQLDHVHNDGAKHRREHKTGAKILAALKKLGWPKDRYRILCANCNHGRAMNGGICPHQL